MSNNQLYHYGIKGMKWGVRRFQNENGTLTAEGKKRYGNPVKSVRKFMLNNDLNAATARDNASKNRMLQERSEAWDAYSSRRHDLRINAYKNSRDRVEAKQRRLAAKHEKLDAEIQKREARKERERSAYQFVTDSYERGFRKHTEIIERYRNVKLTAFDDKMFKKDPQYKEAVRDYVVQKMQDRMFGAHTVASLYAKHDLDDRRQEYWQQWFGKKSAE